MIVWDKVYTERVCSGGVLDDVDLLVCEVATNAVRHSASG